MQPLQLSTESGQKPPCFHSLREQLDWEVPMLQKVLLAKPSFFRVVAYVLYSALFLLSLLF